MPYIADWREVVPTDPMEVGGSYVPLWWQGPGNYNDVGQYDPYTGAGAPAYSLASSPNPVGLLQPGALDSIQAQQLGYTQGFYNHGTFSTGQGTDEFGGAFGSAFNVLNPATAIPKLDFGNYFTYQQGEEGRGQNYASPTQFGASPELINYLNQTYAPQLNQNILSAMQSGGADPYGIREGGIAGSNQILWSNTPDATAQMFGSIGAMNDPQVQQYLQALQQSQADSASQASAFDAKSAERERNGMMATLAVMTMGAGLGALGGAAFAPSEMALSTLAGEMASTMAAQGFSQAAIQSALAANGLAGGVGAAGAAVSPDAYTMYGTGDVTGAAGSNLDWAASAGNSEMGFFDTLFGDSSWGVNPQVDAYADPWGGLDWGQAAGSPGYDGTGFLDGYPMTGGDAGGVLDPGYGYGAGGAGGGGFSLSDITSLAQQFGISPQQVLGLITGGGATGSSSGSGGLGGLLSGLFGGNSLLGAAVNVAPIIGGLAYAANQNGADTSRLESLYNQYNPQAATLQYDLNTTSGRNTLNSNLARRGVSGSSFANADLNSFNTLRDIGRQQVVNNAVVPQAGIAGQIMQGQLTNQALKNDLYGRGLSALGVALSPKAIGVI